MGKLSRHAQISAPALLLFALISAPTIWNDGLDFPDAFDERTFHHPTIQQFCRELPFPDLADYMSATGPLYHLAMAPLCRVSGDDLEVLRVANYLLGIGLLLAVASLLARSRSQPAWGLALAMLPIATSLYVIGPSVRLSTDVAAWLLVVLSLSALDRAQSDLADASKHRWMWHVAFAAAAATAAVLTRQLHIWLAGMIALFALVNPLSSHQRGLVLGLSAAPPLALLPLVLLWGGLTPPFFAGHQVGPNPEVALIFFALLGFLAVFFTPWLLRELGTPRATAAAAATAMFAGWGLIALAPLPYRDDDMTIGGVLWRASSLLPDVLGTAATLWVLVPIGVFALLAILAGCWRQRDWLVAFAIVGFLVVNLPSVKAYQKYYEPFLLIILTWLVSRRQTAPAWWWAGVGLLGALWLGLAVLRFEPLA